MLRFDKTALRDENAVLMEKLRQVWSVCKQLRPHGDLEEAHLQTIEVIENTY